MRYTREQLQQIADDAHDRIQETYALFAIPGEPPQISAGMVKCVLEASASLAIPLIPPEPTLRLEPHEPTPQPERKPFHPTPEPQPQPKPATEPDYEPTDADLITFLLALSTDGTLPSAAQYDRSRPDNYPPSAALAARFDCRWTGLAKKTGLKLSGRQLNGKRLHQRKQEATATDDAKFRHRNGAVSDEAKAVLGPEHVVINGYK